MIGMHSVLYNLSYAQEQKKVFPPMQTMLNLNAIETTSPSDTVDSALKSTSTFPSLNVTGTSARESRYDQPLSDSTFNTTNNASLTESGPNNTRDQGSNNLAGYDAHGSSSKSGSTTASEHVDNSRKLKRSPPLDQLNLGQSTSNTKDDKSGSHSADHKSNHHTDNISNRHLTGDKNVNEKVDDHKNRISEKLNSRQQQRYKVPLKLPIPFP
jgi:hypothetical protein